MPGKKDNLPLTLENDSEKSSTVSYATEVIAIIAGVAANEVEGVAGMCSGGSIAEVFGRNKNVTKGVKVEIGTEEASVDLYLTVEYGTPIQTAAGNVQENVRKAIESMTGLHVVRVDVHVLGVSFATENTNTLPGLDSLADHDDDEPTNPIVTVVHGEVVETLSDDETSMYNDTTTDNEPLGSNE